MYASIVIILISGNSQSPLLGNAEVKNLSVQFHFLMKILPYKKSVCSGTITPNSGQSQTVHPHSYMPRGRGPGGGTVGAVTLHLPKDPSLAPLPTSSPFTPGFDLRPRSKEDLGYNPRAGCSGMFAKQRLDNE